MTTTTTYTQRMIEEYRARLADPADPLCDPLAVEVSVEKLLPVTTDDTETTNTEDYHDA